MSVEYDLYLSQARRTITLPDGNHPSLSTLARWCVKGCRGVRLAHQFIGRRIVTNRESLSKFFAEIAERAAQPSDGPTAPDYSRAVVHGRRRSDKQRARDLAHANRELAKSGF